MTPVVRIKIAKILYNARFWGAIAVLYMMSRGFTAGEAFFIGGWYYLFSLILEYPTGVIGDRFSHRLSVTLGYLILAASFFLITFDGSMLYYLTAFFLLALGETLTTGSDAALLYTASSDYQKDYSDVKTSGIIVASLAMSLGGFAASYDLRYPYYLTMATLLVSAWFAWSSGVESRSKFRGNVFDIAREGIRYVFTESRLFHLLFLSSLAGGIFYGYKWMYNPLFLEMNLPVASWGVLSGISVLLVAGGSLLYRIFPRISLVAMSIFLAIFLSLAGVTSAIPVAILGLFAIHIVRGYFETRVHVEINDSIGESVRASILSFGGLCTRLGTMVFLGIAGLALEYHVSLFLILIGTSLAFLVLGGYSLFFLKQLEYERKES